MPLAVGRIEVLMKTRFPAEPDDATPQSVGVLLETVVLQPVHQEPVYVQPDRSPPVFYGREPEAVHVVAGHRRDVFVGEAEPVVLQGIDQRLVLASSGILRTEARSSGRSSVMGSRRQVVVEVDAVLLAQSFPSMARAVFWACPQGADPRPGYALSRPCRAPSGKGAS